MCMHVDDISINSRRMGKQLNSNTILMDSLIRACEAVLIQVLLNIFCGQVCAFLLRNISTRGDECKVMTSD